jgi:putative restriction endonuclease
MDRDLEFRLAVFGHVARLRELHGGLIPAPALSQGIMFEGERVPIWNQQKGIFRPAALRQPGAALTVMTSVDSPYDDRFDEDDDRIWYRYRGNDPQHADNVAVRLALELQCPLLYLVGIEPGLYDAIFPVYAVEDRPEAFAFGLRADNLAAVVEAPGSSMQTVIRREHVTRAVQQRLHQHRFRAAVLKAYARSCTICRLRHTPLLDAAHILPDQHPHGLPEIPNGLSLCKIHHSALDASILGVDDNYRVHIRKDVLVEKDGPMLKHGLQDLHGESITLPRNAQDRPNRDYLAERFAVFLAA